MRGRRIQRLCRRNPRVPVWLPAITGAVANRLCSADRAGAVRRFCILTAGLLALLVSMLVVVTTPAPILAQDDTSPPSVREIRVEERRFRFAVPRTWTVKEDAGIWFAHSPDKKLLMLMVTLDHAREIPEALSEFDKLIVVTGSKFGKPTTTVHRFIPMQTMPGKGTLQPVGQPVELLAITLNVVEKPVLAMFYVHDDAFKRHLPDVTAFLNSFGLLLTNDELTELKKRLDKRKSKDKGAFALPK